MDTIEEKISETEKRLTEKITNKMSNSVDKRINAETVKIRKGLDDRLNDMRKEMDSDLLAMEAKLVEAVDSRGDRQGSRVSNTI